MFSNPLCCTKENQDRVTLSFFLTPCCLFSGYVDIFLMAAVYLLQGCCYLNIPLHLLGPLMLIIIQECLKMTERKLLPSSCICLYFVEDDKISGVEGGKNSPSTLFLYVYWFHPYLECLHRVKLAKI